MNGLQIRAKRYSDIISDVYRRNKIAARLHRVVEGPRHLSYNVLLADPMNLKSALGLADNLSLACNVNSVLVQQQAGLVQYQIQKPEMYYWQPKLSEMSGFGIGLRERRELVDFKFDVYPHALLTGTTGSGKTESLKTILLTLMRNYSPSELGIVLCDPKVELDDFNYASHLIMPVAQNREEIGNAVNWVLAEFKRRREQRLRDDRRIMLVVDEISMDEVKPHWDGLEMIAGKGRGHGLHLIAGTQKPTKEDLPSRLSSNLTNRFVGMVVNSSDSVIATGHAGLMAHKLSMHGDFLHVCGPEVERFQVALAGRQDFDRLERAEINSVEVEYDDLPEYVPEPEERQTGRPPVKVDPKILAHYFHYGPDKITEHHAREHFNLARTGHKLHKDFCKELDAELDRLEANDGTEG